MDRNLALEFVRVTEAAALAAAAHMGRGDEAVADAAAVSAMYQLFPDIEFNGRLFIGEGDEDSVPMLYADEALGTGKGPEIEVIVDALESATSCALGGPNAIAAIAIAEQGGFLRCPPDIYMEKIAVGAWGKGVIDLDVSMADNLAALAEVKGVKPQNLRVVVLDRPRHAKLLQELRDTDVHLKLISDGDLSAALATTREESGVDLLVGTGRAAQGILAAVALQCLGGEIQARFQPGTQDEVDQLRQIGVEDLRKKYTAEDLAQGSVVFAATGVTTGEYLRGVRFFPGGGESHSVVMRSKSRTIRFLNTFHYFEEQPEY
jgi:fructose-1,6-bisphosphatase II